MKAQQWINGRGTLAAAALFFVTGCACHDVRTSQRLVSVEASPGAAQQGYVEFYTLSSNFPFPVFLLDEQSKPFLLAGIGLQNGAKYSYTRHGAPVAEKLRVALPPGTHQFMIEREGQRVLVPVQAGRLTPVELDYIPLDTAINWRVYRLDARIFSPGPIQENPKSPRQ